MNPSSPRLDGKGPACCPPSYEGGLLDGNWTAIVGTADSGATAELVLGILSGCELVEAILTSSSSWFQTGTVVKG